MPDIGIYNTQAKTINELDNNKFRFLVHNLPNVSWKVQTANIPGQRLPTTHQATSLNPLPLPGLNIEYDPFDVSFIVDEKMDNYIEVINWMRGLGMPTNSLGYVELIKKAVNDVGPQKGIMSDAVLTIYSKQSVPLIDVRFVDMFPTNLSGITFTNDESDVAVQVATVSFAYSYFEITTDI